MNPFDGLFREFETLYRLPAGLLEAIARKESSLRPNVVTNESNGRHSYGLFQILDSTARGLGYTGDWMGLLDPIVNTTLAAMLSAEIIARQGGFNPVTFYSEYNSGSPTLWERSAEVAEHVTQFLGIWATVAHPAATAAGAIVAGLALIWFFRRQQR